MLLVQAQNCTSTSGFAQQVWCRVVLAPTFVCAAWQAQNCTRKSDKTLCLHQHLLVPLVQAQNCTSKSGKCCACTGTCLCCWCKHNTTPASLVQFCASTDTCLCCWCKHNIAPASSSHASLQVSSRIVLKNETNSSLFKKLENMSDRFNNWYSSDHF